MANLTGEFDCPQKLAPGDVVKASVRGHYYHWAVFEVQKIPGDELRTVVLASAPKMGSVRFIWFGGHHRTGTGHGLTFYFVRRPTPTNGTLRSG